MASRDMGLTELKRPSTSIWKDNQMILCCGEALIDMIPEPTSSGQVGFVPHCGGAVFNTAIALGRLGVGTGMLTGLSNDMFGRQLTDALTNSCVGTHHVVTSNRPTTLAFVNLVNGHASYVFYDEKLCREDAWTTRYATAAIRHFCNVFWRDQPLLANPVLTHISRSQKLNSSGRAIILDPNIRSGFISDEAKYRARLDVLISRSDVVKVSDEDLNWIIPESMPLQEKANTLLNAGPSFVIVTRGGEGATGYLSDGKVVDVPAERVQIVDTVGAGDTFNAGVMAILSKRGLLTKDGLASLSYGDAQDALSFGAKIAAVTVSRAGANPPWADELKPDEGRP